MFFPERVKCVRPHDRVLEVGPGATPHPASHLFLEKRFSEDEAVRQRGGLPSVKFDKPTVYFDGGRFPFRDKEFDYVICSQVLEHIPNLEVFVNELFRVAPRGYLEFPTIYYEYLYNFDEHLNLLCYRGGTVLWMPKSRVPLNDFAPAQRFLRSTLEAGYDDIIQSLKPFFFQGFEWSESFAIQEVHQVGLLAPEQESVPMRKGLTGNELLRVLTSKIRTRFSRIVKTGTSA
jgi:SAM-dependent methyltransferase